MQKLPQPPKPEEQIRPDALVRTIRKEKPAAASENLKDIPVTPENYKKFKGGGSLNRGGLPRGLAWGILGLVVLFVVGSIISFYVFKKKVKQSIASQAETLTAGVADLQNFDTQSAGREFSSLMATNSTPSFENALGAFGSLFTGGRNAVASFGDLAKQLAALSDEAGSLENAMFEGGFVSQLTNVRDTLAAIDADSNRLSGALTSAGESSALGGSDFYLPLRARVEGAETFLNAFIPWLASSTPHRVIVLLQNPSEMRPGGGFLGSYADITIASGSIANIAVHDIADVDAGFMQKIIPPPPLQLEVKNFRPADANWFFDFPTSASKTMQFFEESNLYAGSGATGKNAQSSSPTIFDGAIAVSPKVVSDLLSITGPITISSTSTKQKIVPTTFTADNVLVQIQNIVQQGQATGNHEPTATYPKAVLGELSRAIFTQLASSTDSEKQQLLSMAFDWFAKRDVMAYFSNSDFENFILSYGAAGDVYQLPQNFNGDYLAIVDANIRGDKSDLYVAQKVSFDAQIGADGTITDTLKIDRTHNGNQSPYWWYQTTNQDYLQIFVPDGSSLENETGGIKKTITAPISYARNGYSTDPTVAAIASSTQPLFIYPAVTTHEEDGKEVFATWAVVPKGKTTSLEFDYTHRAFLPPADGTPYQFVFEKQAGSVRSYDFEIDAPLGYVFAENDLATYDYTSNDPPGRLIVNLTLQKI